MPAAPAISVMIEKFAPIGNKVPSGFLDLNHTDNSRELVSLQIPKFAHQPGREFWRTSE